VGDVFLDELEVTYGCYAACVDDGACSAPIANPNQPEFAWDAPENAPFAVRVDMDQARQFCTFRGGRLATALEFVRASHGDVLHIANPDLWAMAYACRQSSPKPTECELLWLEAEWGGMASGEYGADRGPFGHRDLFGGLPETTASELGIAASPGVPCTYAQDSSDPGSFEASEQIAAGRLVFWGGNDALWTSFQTPDHDVTNIYPDWGDEVGVRCAYDPVYVDGE
jgi:formylglycine-generating enzyme required for sulfatase activity